jgi:hypothetical protein
MQTIKRYIKSLNSLREEYSNVWLAAFSRSTDPFAVLSEEFIQGISHESREYIFRTIVALNVFNQELEQIAQLVHAYAEYQENITVESQETSSDPTEQEIECFSTANIEFVQRSIQLIIDIYRAVLTVHI